MSVTIVTPEQWQTQQWKNGGGVTYEIYKEEQNATMQFRLSVAEVSHNGPFSVFPGVDRYIHLLEGAGFRLHQPNGAVSTIDYTDCAFPFSGDDNVQCTLIDGSIKDFNLMVNRTTRRAIVSDVLLDGGTLALSAEDTIVAIFVLEGQCNASVAAQLRPFTLGQYSTVIARNETGHIVVNEGQRARCLVMRLQAQ